jgi:membrane protease YdiL (CAAX protease family)
MTTPLAHDTTAGRLRDGRAGIFPAGRSAGDDRRSVRWFVVLCMALVAGAVAASAASPQLVPFALALGPAVIAIGLAAREGDGAVRRLLGSLIRRPSQPRWYLAIGIPVLWALGVVAIGIALGFGKDDLFGGVFPAAVIVPLVVLGPALAEELAWRGFAVSRLTRTMSPLKAALVLSVPWTVMHLVLHLPGGINDGAALWPTVLDIVAYSIVLTWVFVGSGGSALLTGLVHAGLNGVVPLMSGIDLDAAWAIRALLAAVIAIAIVAFGGFRRLRVPDAATP